MVEKNICTGCGACGAVCPVKAIEMRPDREGFLYPKIDRGLCVGCGSCDKVCPITRGERKPGEHYCFGAQAEAEKLCAMGSSGGVFLLLASHILAQGGAVFGAALLEDGSVRHICVRRQAELERISRTKYVQSDLSQVWDQLRPLLNKGPVLFCGTPCQTDAVRTFLGEDRAGAVLVDLICYGVPSPGIWARYVRYLETKYAGKLEAFLFRDKRAEYGRACSFQIGGKEYFCPLGKNLFCRSYFKNINIRPACFQCGYATVERTSDLTLGDFWGLEAVQPRFDNGGGCSVVLCHTPTGLQLWEQVKEQARWFACRPEDAANASQPRLRTPTRPSPMRALWMGLYGRIPFSMWLRLFGKQEDL